MNDHADELSRVFTDSKEKIRLQIDDRRYVSYKQMSIQDYENAFLEFNLQISKYIKNPKFVEALKFNFSTSTPIYKSVGYATTMSTLKHYFEYCYNCCGCQIPYIQLEGSENDWKLLISKFKTICNILLHQMPEIESILKRILESKQGNVDLEFWKDFIHKDFLLIVRMLII